MSGHDWSVWHGPGHRLVVTAVHVSACLSKAADRYLRKWRLTLAQFNILVVLLQQRHGLPQAHLGERLVVSRANVTGLVRRMKALGLVRIVGEEGDARIKRVQITPAGTRLMRRIERPWFREIDRLTGSLNARELDPAADLLDRLKERI